MSIEATSAPQVSDLREEQIAELRQEISKLMTLVQAKQEHIPDSMDKQIAAIQEEIRSLTMLVQTKEGITIRNAVFENTMVELKDLKVLVKSSAMAAPINAANPSHDNHDCCGDQPCGCVSKDCCCFEIVLYKVRAAKPQIEPADMGDLPGVINALEVQIYVTVEDIGFLWPGLASTMDLRADGAPGGPGPWVIIERVINRVYVKKGTIVTTQLNVEVREHDEGIERPVGLKDEIGEASGSITLDCCMSKIYPPMPIDVPLIFGGEGRGMVQAAFYARRVCC